MRSLIREILFSGFLFLLILPESFSQVEFGVYSEEELALEQVPFEPEAKRVTLYEEASVYFKINGIFADHHYRIKVLDDNVEDFGDIRILFYKGSDVVEDITKLQAQVSYLEEGERKVQKLINKVDIKEVNLGEGFFEFRIAFPHVKKGSILEYSYTKMDKSIRVLEGWAFQKEIPGLMSKFTFKAPDFLQYQMITQGKILQEVAEISQKKNTFSWTVKNIHSVPNEPYVGNLIDYQVRVDGYLFTDEYVKKEDLETSDIFYASWNQMANRLLEGTEQASYLVDKKDPKIKYPDTNFKDSTNIATAIKIYNYVRGNYKAYNSRWLEPIYTLSEYLEKKEGNSFDKNLLLSHLLKLEGIESHIVMVNNRESGRKNLIETPYIHQFYSSVLVAKIDNKQVFLDATDSIMPFGLIPRNKLVPKGFFLEKGNGRLDDINVTHRSGILHLAELEFDSTGNLQLSHQLRYTDYSAIDVALILKEKKYEESLKESGIEKELFDFSFQDQLRDKRNVLINYKTRIENSGSEYISVNPFELSDFKKNPFSENIRILPIEFYYPMFENFNFNMKIPEGYELVDFPESQVITIPSKGVKFSYQIEQLENQLKINSRIELLNDSFPASEYGDLKFILESIASKLSVPVLLKKL